MTSEKLIKQRSKLADYNYNKGFSDGKAEALAEIKSEIIFHWKFLINEDNFQGARELELLKNKFTDLSFEKIEKELLKNIDNHSDRIIGSNPIQGFGSDTLAVKGLSNAGVGSTPMQKPGLPADNQGGDNSKKGSIDTLKDYYDEDPESGIVLDLSDAECSKGDEKK